MGAHLARRFLTVGGVGACAAPAANPPLGGYIKAVWRMAASVPHSRVIWPFPADRACIHLLRRGASPHFHTNHLTSVKATVSTVLDSNNDHHEKVVLLAEDDRTHELLFRRAVMQSSIACRVDVVHDGSEAIDYLFATGAYSFRDPHDLPDLILLDLKMPKMNGIQVLKVLRRVRWDDRTRVPPVVVLTGSDDDRDILEAYHWGAQSYILKPMNFPEFARAVRETLEYWLGLNRALPRHRVGVHIQDDVYKSD
jgi:two-component system, response regulator